VIHFSNDTGPVFTEAIRVAQQKVKKLIENQPDLYPLYTKNGRWKHEGVAWTHWCDGFLPGMMWIFRRRAESGSKDAAYWNEQAIRYTKPLESRKLDTGVHDLGFIFLSSYHRWYALTRDPALNEVLIQAGRTLAQRFKEKGGYLRSFVGDDSLFIDIMMNVGIIFYAARETGDKRLREIALKHCFTTRRHLIRGDGSAAHEGIFNIETGEFLHQSTQQGWRRDSCWSRGLTWGMYGFSRAYEYSRDPHFLDTAQQTADYYISHCPSDGIPPWDFNAPLESRKLVDSSAAAIMAAGLFRLCRMVSDPIKGHFYWSTAVRILRSLCDKYLAKGDSRWEGILKGGVYHVHKELGVDESVMWGEYFFVEALDQALRGF
jgi:unsaturated chondroitin disaccharide hydrolase